MTQPPFLSECDPETRLFPTDWKWAYYRLHGGIAEGYKCPICGCCFFGPQAFGQLHGDHIFAWSKGGRTTWGNLQLLCGPCNIKKTNS